MQGWRDFRVAWECSLVRHGQVSAPRPERRWNRCFYLFSTPDGGLMLKGPTHVEAMAQVPECIGESSSAALLRARSGSALAGFVSWMADTLNHAFGNPREEGAHQPPLVGVQPYRDRPERRRRF